MTSQLTTVLGDTNGPVIQWAGEDLILVRSASLIRFPANTPDDTFVRIDDTWGQSGNGPTSIVYDNDSTDVPITQLDANGQVIELLKAGGQWKVWRKEVP